MVGSYSCMTSIKAVQEGPVKTVLRDLSLSVEWSDLRVVPLTGTDWTVIIGHKRRDDPLRAVVALPLHTTVLVPSELKRIFTSLAALRPQDIPERIPPYVPSIEELQDKMGKKSHGLDDGDEKFQNAGSVNETIDSDMIYVAIMTSDSTVVYYRLSRGIKKPADIPDE